MGRSLVLLCPNATADELSEIFQQLRNTEGYLYVKGIPPPPDTDQAILVQKGQQNLHSAHQTF